MIEVRKGVGVTKEKLRQGLDHMLQGCGKPKRPVRSNGGEAGACSRENERQPPGSHTCTEQFRWGKCDELWMTEGHFCDFSCGRCGNGGNDSGSGNGTTAGEDEGRATLQQVYG